MKSEMIDQIYKTDYIRKVHRIGTITMACTLILTFIPAIYLSFIRGLHPGWNVLATAFSAMAGIEVMAWIGEPIFYFPLLGITGSYVSFITGNVTNMRIPATIASQNTIQAKPGTKRAEIAGVFGLIGSVFVNFVFLFIVVLGGTYILKVLPKSVTGATIYVLPGIFGSLFITFLMRVIPSKKGKAPEKVAEEEAVTT